MTPAGTILNHRRACVPCSRRWARRSLLGCSGGRHQKRALMICCAFTLGGTSSVCWGRSRVPAMLASTPTRSFPRLLALRAAGAVVAAVDAVVAKEADNAFCAVRPPGHHAEPERAMGFCLFNNAAIGALRAREVHGLARVAVVDFDVHHGNGTQAAFETDSSLFYASTHQYPLYPGTGSASETGVGNIVNVPLRPMSGSGQFRLAMSQRILPALEAFRPELVLVSAGFDAHRSDPLAQLMLGEADYTWVTERLLEIAYRHAKGRLVATLEGGYDLPALAASAAAHVRVLMSV